jgi:hypothetical protein
MSVLHGYEIAQTPIIISAQITIDRNESLLFFFRGELYCVGYYGVMQAKVNKG